MCSCVPKRIKSRSTKPLTDEEIEEIDIISETLGSLMMVSVDVVVPHSSPLPFICPRYCGARPPEKKWERHIRVRVSIQDGMTFVGYVFSVNTERRELMIAPREDNLNAALASSTLRHAEKPVVSMIHLESAHIPHQCFRTLALPDDICALH
jgi:hypothetical protein